MNNTLSRRQFMRSAFFLIAITLSGVVFFKLYQYRRAGYSLDTIITKIRARMRYSQALDAEEKRSLQRYIDLLIPDDSTPGAIAAGVDQIIFKQSATQPYYRKTVREGLIRIDQLASRKYGISFYALNRSQATDIIATSEKAAFMSLERDLFLLLRNQTLTYYYSEPAYWPGLCYEGPPQPTGFMNRHLDPNSCRPG